MAQTEVSSKLMKVVHLGKYYPPFFGGIENFMAELIEQQGRQGHSVAAIVHHHHHKYRSFEHHTANKADIYRVASYGQLAYAPVSPGFGYALNKVIKKHQPDVLHLHLPNLSAFWCLFSLAARKIPWVVHWHADVLGNVPDLKIKLLYPLYRVFETALLKRAAKVIATSPVYFDSSAPLKSFKDKVVVIPLGLPDQKMPIETPASPINSSLRLLMVGRLTYYKGHSLLLQALAKLKASGLSLQLSVIGSGELGETLSRQVATLELQDQVKLLGKVSDKQLNTALQTTDLLCLPSIERTEAFGVVLLEAMRAGKACLVTDVPGSGMSWVVQDHKTGRVVKHNDIEDLANSLAEMNRDRSSLSLWGSAGRHRFVTHFSIKQVSEQISHLYSLQ